MIAAFRTLWRQFLTDHLFRNSMYLMVTTGAMGVLGFFFWLICTRLFTPEEVGVGTTLISAMTLISFTSLLGFNSTFVRSLPSSTDRNSEINTGSTLVIVAAALLSLAYILIIPSVTPSLVVVRDNLWYVLGFAVMVAFASVNSLTDSIFVAYRAAQYNLITDGLITSGSKLLLPIIFASLGGYGVFAASGLAASIGMVASIAFLAQKFEYRPRPQIDTAVLKKVFRYSSGNYIANLTNMIPTLVLPIIVIDNLGSAAAAYYYLAFMVINLLYSVSTSVSQSLFAEGSYTEQSLRTLLRQSMVILVALMFPAAIVLALAGPFVLGFFGKSYSEGGSMVIIILAIAAPAVAAYNLGTVLLRIRQQVASLLLINIIYAASICAIALYWAHRGLTWIAIAWAIGNLVAAVLSFFAVFVYRGQPTPTDIRGLIS